MPASPPNSTHPNRHFQVERPVRACEPCRRRKRPCNGLRPCAHCKESQIDCVYSVVADLPRSVFTTSSARRLSSGSACETCRRRKTKCDGGSPCGFCAGAGIECINNSERRRRASHQQLPPDNEAIDRIEDRLRRIEKLMTAFTPTTNSPLANSNTTSHRAAARRHRHSVQGIVAVKEQAELNAIYGRKKHHEGMSPPGSPLGDNAAAASSSSSSSSPPMIRQSSVGSTQPLTSSMLNLTLSPSSSTSSAASALPPLASSMSTPSSAEWESSSPSSSSLPTIPSLMDQLSKRTFGNTPSFTFPPYPLTPPPRPPPSSLD
ncbi:hypothetical protein O0I10_000925 [Lichtheimia ornata]|uniref:Zn(2)-C6 fungal-type domain-containing protein n=1 Tax=Lichtheimia ornata TaxID=688661 RepID=A0AAD8DJJ3_9FUNG|nr:uncharacterized protein O0I10_000925 [Lichtheimia ornata]KAJ8663677.1 hypothetical protein O0I10_000925 [Lichtheimia ornata]